MTSGSDSPKAQSCDGGAGHLLDFVLPGIVHRLGNSLFAAKGAIHCLDLSSNETPETLDEIKRQALDATDRSGDALNVLRWLATSIHDPTSSPADRLLEVLADVLRMPMGEFGLGLEVMTERERPERKICAAGATHALFEVARTASLAMPPASRATLRVTVTGRTPTLRCEQLAAPGYLPFPLDFDSIAAAVQSAGLSARAVGGSSVEIEIGHSA